MASSFSTSLKLEKMVTGEKAGLWGTVTNTNLDLIQEAVGGYISIAVTNADIVTTIADGASSNGRNFVIKLTGTLAANRNVTVPDSIEKAYIVIDATDRSSSHFTLTFKTASGSGVTLPVGSTSVLYSDGTNIVKALVEKGYKTTTTAYTAVNGDQIFVDTSSTAVTITLPASPAVGNEVHFIDSKLSFNSNNLIINRNSEPINGAASNLTVSENGESFTLVYANSTKGWIFKTKKD
jgi:hypothetical protein|tara:strand:+ start:584 stop:1294 length:711 start_codon:yes stop_codon:yes gene_type:complete